MGRDLKITINKAIRQTGAGLLVLGLMAQSSTMIYAADSSSLFNNITLSASYKSLNENNPIVTQRYSADPGVMVYNDTVYIYCTNDTLEYGNGGIAENTYSKIQTLNCFSSKDLVNWTDHGTIQVAGNNGAAKWAGCSWAPYATHKTINGKEKFFLYFANNACGIGVLESDSPTGPWTDPIGKALVDPSTPNCSSVVWCFDPAVLVDEDGTGYLYFGGGVPSGQAAHPKTARVVKLGENMTSLAGTPVAIDAPYLFEDSGINKIGSKYYYSYCSNWSTAGSGINAAAIEYMVGSSPIGPFTYAGEVFKNPGLYFKDSTGNNHHTIFEFKGDYYLAYHARTLEQAAIGQSKGYRSTHIDKLTVNNGQISEVKGTMTGSGQAAYLNPYEKVQAETMAVQAGVSISGSGDTKVTDINRGDWIGLKGVEFSQGLSQITVSAKSNASGAIKVCTGSPSGEVLGYIDIPNTNGAFKEITGTLSSTSGVKDLYFVFSNDMELDYWQAAGKDSAIDAGKPTDTTVGNYATLQDGWYYIKNTNAQKYLQVSENTGANGQNVEIAAGTGTQGQKWYLTNAGNGYVTLKNGLGYMLDISGGINADGTNVQIYSANNMDAQKFKLVPTSENGVYGILTKSSGDTKSLDVYNFGVEEGSNVCQWTYYQNSCQTWVLESCQNTGTSDETNNQPSTTPDNQASKAAVDLKVLSDWGDGATAEITLTNLTGKDLNGWQCTFTANREITAVWSADLKSSNGQTYTISNPAWQPELKAGESYTFGCALGSGPANVVVTDASVK